MSRFTCPNINDVVGVIRSKGYRVYETEAGHDLNIAGIRGASSRSNNFDDWITVSYMFDGIWNGFAFPATTDPGTYYRENPMNVRGTAVVRPGQYRGAHEIGRHKGYKALTQKSAITVYRDSNQDATIDTASVAEESGSVGINIHRANRVRASTLVEKWSAGCQVFQDPDHFDFFMTLCQRGADKFGNSFTYTLLEEADF